MVTAVNRNDEQDRKKATLTAKKKVKLSEEEIDEATIRREMKWYEEKKEEYLQKYEGKYIALLNGELLDSDDDFSDLATRVYEKYGYIAIFMTLVTRRTKPYRISSPRFKRNKIV